MIQHLPVYIPILFIITTIITLLLFAWVLRSSAAFTAKRTGIILLAAIGWLILQGLLAYNQVYSSNLTAVPPKFLVMGLLPPMLLILLLFLRKDGRTFIDSLPLQPITMLNIIRIPVEIGLFRLFIQGAVPQLMTFEGGNLDIISGLTAPVIAYFAFKDHGLNRRLLLIWNFVCLGLLANIVVRAVLSAPLPFQRLAFDQPNIAILHFPFVWLPAFIVPLVLFGHLTSIRRILLANS